MGILKKFGFVTDDGESAAPTETPVAVPSPRTRPVVRGTAFDSLPTQNFVVPGFGASSAVAPDPEIIKTLNDAAEQSKVPGYAEFAVNRETLNGLPDVQKYALALNLTQANHKIAPAAVLASLDDRAALIDAQEAEFAQAMDDAVTNEVTKRQQEAAKLDEEITKLAATIQDKSNQRNALAQEATESETAIAQQRAVFAASINVVRTAQASEREKIAGIISTTPAK